MTLRAALTIAALTTAAVWAGACATEPGVDACQVGSASQAVQAADRKILGAGAVYAADATLRGRAGELYRSQMLRRQQAWRTIAKVLAPVPLAEPLPGMVDATLPAWQTWYGKDDVVRLFQRLYEQLDDDGRRARQRFDQADIDQALGWNVTHVDELANWPQERWDEYLAAIDTAEELAGVGGIAPVSYSTAATRHLLRSYPEALHCMAAGAPAAFVDTPGDSVQQALREPLELAGCASRTYGPYFVTAGERLQVSLQGTASGARTIIYRAGEADDDCASAGDAGCEAQGPGAFYVSVRAGTEPLSAVVHIDYSTPNAAWAGCLEDPFPTSSVVVKAHWQRAQFGIKLPVFDTSAEALTSRMAKNSTQGWGPPDREGDPGADKIYTLELANDNRFRLAALHIMTKELDHWQWITMWWSDEPDTDFGEDRPSEIAALGGPWANYKMCAVTMFDEGDADPRGGFASTAPSLAESLAVVHARAGGPSWCSNPYLEAGAGNMATNCIGCHQHGGTSLLTEQILTFPAFGALQERNNFPHDYSWALTLGDRLGSSFHEIVRYYDQ